MVRESRDERNGSTDQKQELVRGFFLQGLPFSNERKLFEPGTVG